MMQVQASNGAKVHRHRSSVRVVVLDVGRRVRAALPTAFPTLLYPSTRRAPASQIGIRAAVRPRIDWSCPDIY